MRLFLFAFLVFSAYSLPAVPAAILSGTIFKAAKVSGTVLSAPAEKAACSALRRAAIQYGDDVLYIVEKSGLEALEQGIKHGDDFWKFANIASDSVKPSFALHADEWMPHLKKIGPDFLKLENRAPGLALEIVKYYGNDAPKVLLRTTGSADIQKLYNLANKTNDPAIRSFLFQTYQKKGSKLLKHLDHKKIMTGGLSIAAIVAANNATKGITETLQQVAKEHPIAFVSSVISNLCLWGMLFLFVVSKTFRRKILNLSVLIIKQIKQKWKSAKSSNSNR